MSSRLLRDLSILLLMFGGIGLAVYVWNPGLSGTGSLTELVSPEQEEKLGDLLLQQMLLTYSEVTDSSELKQVQPLVDHLLDHSALDTYEYTLHLLQSEQVNAFATVDGHIFVLTGLVDFCERPEQLAAVIAHEIGHIEERHVLEKLIREFSVGLLLSGSNAGEITNFLMGSGFSRLAEKEADRFALDMMIDAGIHPKHMGDVMELFELEQLESGTPNLAFLSTHPSTENRKLAAWSYEVPADFEERELPVEWHKKTEEAQAPSGGKSVAKED